MLIGNMVAREIRKIGFSIKLFGLHFPVECSRKDGVYWDKKDEIVFLIKLGILVKEFRG